MWQDTPLSNFACVCLHVTLPVHCSGQVLAALWFQYVLLISGVPSASPCSFLSHVCIMCSCLCVCSRCPELLWNRWSAKCKSLLSSSALSLFYRPEHKNSIPNAFFFFFFFLAVQQNRALFFCWILLLLSSEHKEFFKEMLLLTLKKT